MIENSIICSRKSNKFSFICTETYHLKKKKNVFDKHARNSSDLQLNINTYLLRF